MGLWSTFNHFSWFVTSAIASQLGLQWNCKVIKCMQLPCDAYDWSMISTTGHRMWKVMYTMKKIGQVKFWSKMGWLWRTGKVLFYGGSGGEKDSQRDWLSTDIQRLTTFFRKPFTPGLRLTITSRHLDTWKYYTSFQYIFRVACHLTCCLMYTSTAPLEIWFYNHSELLRQPFNCSTRSSSTSLTDI